MAEPTEDRPDIEIWADWHYNGDPMSDSGRTTPLVCDHCGHTDEYAGTLLTTPIHDLICPECVSGTMVLADGAEDVGHE